MSIGKVNTKYIILNVLSYIAMASQFCYTVQEASVVPFAPMFFRPGSLKITLAL